MFVFEIFRENRHDCEMECWIKILIPLWNSCTASTLSCGKCKTKKACVYVSGKKQTLKDICWFVFVSRVGSPESMKPLCREMILMILADLYWTHLHVFLCSNTNGQIAHWVDNQAEGSGLSMGICCQQIVVQQDQSHLQKTSSPKEAGNSRHRRNKERSHKCGILMFQWYRSHIWRNEIPSFFGTKASSTADQKLKHLPKFYKICFGFLWSEKQN